MKWGWRDGEGVVEGVWLILWKMSHLAKRVGGDDKDANSTPGYVQLTKIV